MASDAPKVDELLWDVASRRALYDDPFLLDSVGTSVNKNFNTRR